MSEHTAAKDAGWAEVVTRYGGTRHLASADLLARVTGRLFTLCRGTSAWTIESWRAVPDHPTLTPDQMLALPPCEACQEAATRIIPPGSSEARP